MKLLNKIVLFTIVTFSIIASIVSCKKEKKTTYEVTYTFNNTSPSYLVQIWDGTGLNDFSQSVSSPSFTKTVTYDYNATYRCRIENDNSLKSKMQINITYNGFTTSCHDSIFPSLECFRDI